MTGARVDSYRQLFGLRTVEVAGHEFLINGKPFFALPLRRGVPRVRRRPRDRRHRREHGKPVLVGEFGADTVARLHTLTGAMWSEEFRTEMVAMMLRVFERHECVQGEHLWNFADFQTSLGIVRVDGNKKGVFSCDRRPKAGATCCAGAGAKAGSSTHPRTERDDEGRGIAQNRW